MYVTKTKYEMSALVLVPSIKAGGNFRQSIIKTKSIPKTEDGIDTMCWLRNQFVSIEDSFRLITSDLYPY